MISLFDRFRRTEPPEQEDPDVIVDFIFDDGLFFISIENIGSQPATDIRVQFVPKITGVEGTKKVTELPLFSSLLFLPPGKQITTYLDSSAAYFEREEPTSITTTIRFKSRSGKALKNVTRHNLEIYKEIGYLENR